MSDDLLVTTFPSWDELTKAVMILEDIGCDYGTIEPTAPLELVAIPALVMRREVRAELSGSESAPKFSGWIDHHTPSSELPEGSEPGRGICFQRASISVLQPCVADDTKIRLVAHVHGDLTPVLPFLNAVVLSGSFTPATNTFTYMDEHRLVALHAQRITVAKADEIVDAWLCLERIRQLVEKTWANRAQIEPCYETRKKPPALEIYKRLPGTNCSLCGEMTCMAFALRLWAGEVSVKQCSPIYLPEQKLRREALMEICAGLGISHDEPVKGDER